MPAPRAAWRAGACPRPAGSTQPMITSWMSEGATPAASIAALAAVAPSWGAVTAANTPWKAPIGVRLADTMTTSSLVDMRLPPALTVASALLARRCPRQQSVLEDGHERIGDL